VTDGIRHKTCRECQQPFRKNWYEGNKERHIENVRERKERVRQEAREYVWDYLEKNPCGECGESDPTVLEFHHRGNKRSEISKMVADGLSLGSIEKEIHECDVLCSNCHRRKTSRDRGWFRK